MAYHSRDGILAAFRSDKSKHKIILKLSEIINRKCTRDEIGQICATVNKTSFTFLEKFERISQAQQALAERLASVIMQETSSESMNDEPDIERSDDEIDMHAILRNRINASAKDDDLTAGREDTIPNKNKQAQQAQQLELAQPKYNPYLDSIRSYPPITCATRNRVLTDSDPFTRTQFVWNFTYTPSEVQGSVSGTGIDIQNIVSMDCGDIFLPATNFTLFQEYRQISMLISEFRDQASFINGNTRYHFLFDAFTVLNDNGFDRIKLTSSYKETNKIRFTKPINTINTITISFYSPFQILSFPPDRDLQATMTSANPMVVTTSFNHGLNNGDIVFIQNCTAANVSDNVALINTINDPDGQIVANVTANTFQLLVIDSTPLVSPVIGTVLFANQEFFVPLKFEFIPNY